MSCNEQLQGNYRINKSVEFNKVIKAMTNAAQKQVDTINKLVKEYKSKTRNRKQVDWDLVEKCCPMKWVGSGWHSRKVTALDLRDWDVRDQIEIAIKQRGKLAKVGKFDLPNILHGMSIDFTNQSFIIDVWNENHAVDRFNEQPVVQAFWGALRNVKWQARGAKDGGYCQYNCEYQDSANYQDYFGRVGKDMKDWVCNRPF